MTAARSTDPWTSQAAALGDRAPLRRAVLAVLAAHPAGLTDDELAMRMSDQHPGSVGKRRTELAHMGLVEDTGSTRLTRRGRPAIVWAPTDRGIRLASDLPAPKRVAPWKVEDLLRVTCPLCGKRCTTEHGRNRHLIIGHHATRTPGKEQS